MDNPIYEGLTGSQIYELAQKEYWKELHLYWNAVIEYYPETGEFYYKVGPRMCQPAGYIKNGYVSITYNYKIILAHRLAFLIMTGSIPDTIDHNDQDPLNNKWSNLNVSSPSHNKMNMGLYKNNTSGYTGVDRKGKRWRASITVNKKKVYLGTYDSAIQAYAVRRQAEIENGFNINHGKERIKEPGFTERSEVLEASKRMTK